jgi:2-C-methyl-D-erythritol 4-phosphate cytidylyltransferase
MLDEIDCIWLAVAEEIPEEARLCIERLEGQYPNKLKVIVCAGETRAATVLNACECIRAELNRREDFFDPWVLVHDAARPGITEELVKRLLTALEGEPVGALLAVPVADTLKREEVPEGGTDKYVQATLARVGLWQAQTPQAFKLNLLYEALSSVAEDAAPSDESSAIEALGRRPKLVMGAPTNFKLTHPADGELFAALLASRVAAREKSCE